MPYADPEVRKEYRKRYYQDRKEELKQAAFEHYHDNRDEIRARRLELNKKFREKNNQRERERYINLRALALEAYGGKCSCCGESEPLFLEFDHVNNNGAEHRKKIGSSAKALVKWLKDNNYPPEFQILCSNCNQGKKRNGGICPHKQNNSVED